MDRVRAPHRLAALGEPKNRTFPPHQIRHRAGGSSIGTARVDAM